MKPKTIPWLIAIAAATAGLCFWLHRSTQPDRDSASRSAPPDRGTVHSANENAKAPPPALPAWNPDPIHRDCGRGLG